jgi:hypothetical protein
MYITNRGCEDIDICRQEIIDIFFRSKQRCFFVQLAFMRLRLMCVSGYEGITFTF